MADAPGARELSEAAAAYGWDAGRLSRVAGGLINDTYAVAGGPDGAPVAILQRLNPVFAPQVHLDIDAITAHLAARGLETPRLIPTRGGALWTVAGDQTWRALTYVAGITRSRIEHPDQARSAGQLVGRFHRAVADLEHRFEFCRGGVHDTEAHLSRLADALASSRDPAPGEARALAEAQKLARTILGQAAALPPLPALPPRITHGDLKISNIIFFASEPDRARCLIDLDTLAHQSIAHELGDALRSWCNPGGEDEDSAELDLDVLAAALKGYAAGAGDLLDDREIDALAPGLETICVELASRFCADAFEDRYFGWDAARYPSRRAHNLARARGQLALARSVASRRPAITAAARAALAR